MKKVKELKKWIELYNEVHASAEELQLAFDYVKEGIVSEEEIDETYRKAIDLIEHLEFSKSIPAPAGQKAKTGHRCSCACTPGGQRQMGTKSHWRTTRKATKPVSKQRPSTSKATMPTAI